MSQSGKRRAPIVVNDVGARTRSSKFVATSSSCSFLVFDNGISRAERLEFMLAANAACEPAAPLAVSRLAQLCLITDPRHPAVGSYGLFAKTRIASGTVITTYSGVVQRAHGSPVPGTETYGMAYVSHPDLVVDAEYLGNFARFANDPRNTGKSANIVAQNKVTRFGENATVLVARTAINENEELLLDYGKGHVCFPKAWEDRWGRQLTRPRKSMGALPIGNVGGSARVGLTVLWQCTQCGAFNQTLPVPLMACVCHSCDEPRASHAYVVAVSTASLEAAAQAAADAQRRVGEKQKRAGSALRDFAAAAMAAPPATVARGTEFVPATWPMNFPYLSWQIWDPEVPLTMLLDISTFKPQEKISVCEHFDDDDAAASAGAGAGGGGVNQPSSSSSSFSSQTARSAHRITVFNSEAFKAGDEIAVGGGIVLRADDARLSNLGSPAVLCESLVVPLAGDPDDQRDPVAALGLRLVLTNELRHLGVAPTPAAANCRFRLTVDNMGCVYLALVATVDMKAWQELRCFV